ncbi:uncharacterized protein LOC110029451 [Phalaenopsis equestris]|uniref:uncharacterized protein LOC110029451 n=1 Tax=Phalaenopsis equestris TaxID=78828 RepID=UPI0009E519FC|nr:uncharacterized protein LOC110029451 [Phalaenopsis equestris]
MKTNPSIFSSPKFLNKQISPHPSMAITPFFPNISIRVTAPSSPAITMNSLATTRSLILTNHHVRLQTASNSLKKFNPVIKIFEDKESGVICYRDEQGYLICEGYDEGPRLPWQQLDGIEI